MNNRIFNARIQNLSYGYRCCAFSRSNHRLWCTFTTDLRTEMKFLEGNTVGIDLGTTFSAIAMLDKDGNPTVISNADGRAITPSVVLLDEDKVVVGPSFERIAVADPSSIVEAIKREMGNKNYSVVYQNKKLSPEFISALILKKMKQDAEKVIGPITNAVITVPYYFNDVRRKATQDAGKIAG
ncbi:MAG: Hsp70 family protein, partial [Planctomycetaceae bacterium]